MSNIAKDRLLKNQVPEISLNKLKQLWKTQRRTDEIAELLQVSLPYLQAFARRHNLPKRPYIKRRHNEEVPDPTPEEIVARAAECRARWTKGEFERNNCYKVKPVEIRSYGFDGRDISFNATNHIA